ncbi:MAG: translocation/assembly module TamB domain-containing protein [Hormoscilla sp.]
MTNSPNSNHQPDPKSQPDEPGRRGNRLLWWRRPLPVTLGCLLLASAGAGAWYGWRWLHQELAPMVEDAIDGMIDRDFRMGQLESIVPQLPLGNFRLRFGSSDLPPNETDASFAATEAVEVNAALRPMLSERSLGINLEIELIRPEVYLQEDEQGNWFKLTVQPQAETWLKITTDRVAIQDAQIVLVPFSQKSPITLSSINGQLNIFGNNQHFRFDSNGKFNSGGDFHAEGEVQLTQEQANVQLRTQAIALAPLSSLISDFLPVTVQSGILDSNISVRYRNDQPSLDGTVSFKDIAATYASTEANQMPPLYVTETQGRLRFQEKMISLEEVKCLYGGKIPVTAQGEIDIEKGLDVLAQVGPVNLEQMLSTLGVSSSVETTGEVKIGAKIEGRFDAPLVQANLTTTKATRIDKINFQEINARARFINDTLLVDSVEVQPEVGGLLTAKGEVKLGDLAGIALDFMLDRLPGDAIAQLYGISSTDITLGEISASGEIFGPPTDIQGNLSANLAGGRVQGNARMTDGFLQANIQATAVEPGKIYPQVPPELDGPVKAKIELNSPLDDMSLETLKAAATAEMSLASGIVKLEGSWEQNNWQSLFQIDLRNLSEISPMLGNFQVPVTGSLSTWGSLASGDLETIQGAGKGSIFLAGERVDLSGQLQSGKWQAKVETQDLDLEKLSPEVPPDLLSRMTGSVRLAGSVTDAIGPETIEATVEGSLRVADSLVQAQGGLKDGQWQALIEAPAVEVDRLTELGLEIPSQLQGIYGSTRLTLAGDVYAKTLADIEGSGEVVLAAIPVLERGPTIANWAWNGDRIEIERVWAPGLSADGTITPNLEEPLLSELDLNLTLLDVNLAELPVAIAENVTVRGNVDFAGAIGGEIIAPRIDGNLWVGGLRSQDITFEPLLSGPVIAGVGSGVRIDLKGNEDRIALVLKSDYYPESFTVKVDEAIATGISVGEKLLIYVDNFQLGRLNIQPELAPGRLAGKLWGDFNVNLKNCINEFSGTPVQGNCLGGTVNIESPGVGHLQGENLEATFRYGTGLGMLSSASLDLGESKFTLAGKYNILTQTGDGKVTIVRGDIQEILETLHWFNFADIARGLAAPTYARGVELEIFPVGEAKRDVMSQLRRFSEITTLVRRRTSDRESNPIPELAELDGIFTGVVDIASVRDRGIVVNFDLESTEAWKWREYDLNKIVLKGNWADNLLTILPVRISSDETLLAFNGLLGDRQQSGQLRLVNIPVELIERFVPQKLPVDITGKVNVTATLGSGTLENPGAFGEVRLTDGTLNETPLSEAKGSFSLSNGSLKLNSQVSSEEAELVEIEGSIPNLLPMGSVSPISPVLDLKVYVADEGLTLLNILSREQVKWEGGNGLALVKIGGTVDRPVIDGSWEIDNGILTTEQFPEPVTDVKGGVKFDGDRISVESLSGNFSGGQLQVAGALPIIDNFSIVDNPLTIDLENLDLNFQEIFSGEVNGKIVVSGTAISPKIGGNISIPSGNIFLSEAAETQTTAVTSGPVASAEVGIMPELENLQISLGDRVSLRWPGLMNFRARGDLTIDGTMEDMRPGGDIFLPRGNVNLYTTQFRLTENYEHKARFRPSQGLEPMLDIRLETAVTEVAGARQANATSASSEGIFFQTPEISDTPVLGGLGTQTVEIEARVEGPASGIQTGEALTLSSSPRRSESEIIALLGGGFANTLGAGGGTLALANLAGTALLSNIENAIADGLGLTSLRLFPVLNLNQQTNSQQASVFPLGLGAEASTKITESFSASILKILTDDRPAQFSLRYRIDEGLRLRGATNFSGDDRAQIEYELQF